VARSREKKTKRTWLVVAIPLILIIIVGLWHLAPKLEGTPPVVDLVNFNSYCGVSTCFSIVVSDQHSGVRQLWAGLIADGRETVLVDETFPAAGDSSKRGRRQFEVCIEPDAIGISDGTGTLRLVATDYSWRRWFKGNRNYREEVVTIDTRKPEIDVLSRHHYINQGGSGLVVYRVYEGGLQSGVQVGDNFFPGYPGGFADPDIFLAFFALAYNQGEKTPILVSARDKAGNIGKSGFYYLNKPKSFESEALQISDTFLARKLPEFDLPGNSPRLVDKFIEVNSTQRNQNNETIRSLCENPDTVRHWHGRFIRFPNSSRKASFADQRRYVYQGREIGRAVHLGIDLASVEGAPVPAANAGRVVFAGRIGIYGRTVILDHGLGLFSLYAHLSHIAVDKNQMVAAGEIIGKSGMTGLAGGDHLHFGMLIHNTFVNPVEWWDAVWIENNIMSKINAVSLDG
jgi:murein DD-endopeptidase MepM/ murein hydrolase activator NlpD